jgi:hypothetical protein
MTIGFYNLSKPKISYVKGLTRDITFCETTHYMFSFSATVG